MLNDPPHIRIRKDNLPERSAPLLTDDFTSVLTVNNLRASDNGVYQYYFWLNGVADTLSGMFKCIDENYEIYNYN